MSNVITRRDFMNGVAVSVLGAHVADGSPLTSQTVPLATSYPPARTGLRGSHVGSFEMAHALRDGQRPDLSAVALESRYDLVVVGGGLSGLAAAYFYRQRHPHATVLILESNDDFGGHAKRNEFEVDGKKLISYGGTQSIDGPQHKYSKAARKLLTELGVKLERFNTAYDSALFPKHGLKHGVFFKKEVFGEDRLVRQDFCAWDDFEETVSPGDEPKLRAYIDAIPISATARAQLYEMYTSNRDVLAGLSDAKRKHILQTTSCRDFLKTYWQADDEILNVLQTRTHSLWAVGIDAVPASATLALPGFRGLKERHEAPEEEPYIYHFPDGNASLARLLVRHLIPGAAPGQTMEDIVTAPFDYSRLDPPKGPVSLRLNSTALNVKNVEGGVEVAYSKAGTLHRVAAKHAVMACYHAMVPYLVDQGLDETQKKSLHDNVRAPLVYATLAVRNWVPWQKLGVAWITNPGGSFEASVDFPVSLGRYHFSHDPSEPVCLHLEHTPCASRSGLDMRSQYRIGRSWLYSASFDEIEAIIRDELQRMLGLGGFDYERDVAALTVNRWPHGYAYTPTPLFDDPDTQKLRAESAKRPIGRIAIAGSDSGWDAYTHTAFEEAHRAVLQLS